MSRHWRSGLMLLLLLAAMLVIAVVARPALHLSMTALRDRDTREPLPPGVVDDASRLNRTRVTEVWDIPSDPARAEQQLVDLLRRAAAQKLSVSIAGARHSMGGHTIAPDGLVINMLPFNRMRLDPDAALLHVQAGARWSEIIPYLQQFA
jgi:hypothetical protein